MRISLKQSPSFVTAATSVTLLLLVGFQCTFHVLVLLSFQQPMFQTITKPQRNFRCTCSDVFFQITFET